MHLCLYCIYMDARLAMILWDSALSRLAPPPASGQSGACPKGSVFRVQGSGFRVQGSFPMILWDAALSLLAAPPASGLSGYEPCYPPTRL